MTDLAIPEKASRSVEAMADHAAAGLRSNEDLVRRRQCNGCHLLLLGRQAPAPAVETTLDGWRAGGVQVVAARADVTAR